MTLTINILKTNGRRGRYRQMTATLEREVVNKLVPRNIYTRGALILGTGNPYNLLNPAHVACLDVESTLPLQCVHPPGVDSAVLVTDRDTFLQELDTRWRGWRSQNTGGPAHPYEALLHLELAGSWDLHVLATGRFEEARDESQLIENLLSLPVLCVTRPGGMHYVNPAAIIRARIYHSSSDPFRHYRTLPVDPEEI